MGISFGNALSGAAGALVNAEGGAAQGQVAANQINTNNLLDTIGLYRQQAQDQLNRQKALSDIALQGSQKAEADARAKVLATPKLTYKQDLNGNLYAIDPFGNSTPVMISGGGVPTPQSGGAPPAQGGGTPGTTPPSATPPTPLRMTPKLNPTTERTHAQFMVNGQPVLGTIDKQGNYYDGQGNPVTNATPYVPPSQSISPTDKLARTQTNAAANSAIASLAALDAKRPIGIHRLNPRTNSAFTADSTAAVERAQAAEQASEQAGNPAKPIPGVSGTGVPSTGGKGTLTANAQHALDMVRTGRATAADVDASKTLTADEKAAIKAALPK